MHSPIHPHVEPNEFLSVEEIKNLSPKEQVAVHLGQMEVKQPGSVDKLMKLHKDHLWFTNDHLVTYHDPEKGGMLRIRHRSELKSSKRKPLSPIASIADFAQELARALIDEMADLIK